MNKYLLLLALTSQDVQIFSSRNVSEIVYQPFRVKSCAMLPRVFSRLQNLHLLSLRFAEYPHIFSLRYQYREFVTNISNVINQSKYWDTFER